MTGLIDELASASQAHGGPSGEMRRFSAGIRVVTALLCTTLLIVNEERLAIVPVALLLVYCAWAGWLLWMEATERATVIGLWPYWIDVAWSCVTMKLFTAGTTMMIVTLVHPVVLASIGYGVSRGVLIAFAAAVGLLFDSSSELMLAMHQGWRRALPALLVLTLVPAAAVLARPMSVLRRRLSLLDDLEARLDPRRGLEAIRTELVERLRGGTLADVVALVLPSSRGAPAAFDTRDDGSFRAKADAHAYLESLLVHMPDCSLSHVMRRWWDPRPRTRLHHAKLAVPRGLSTVLTDLAGTLDVNSLHVVPLTRYARRHGHFVVGYTSRLSSRQDLAALAGAAPELLRVIEQATLVDQLQDESAGHERARIGRDLHDSAIQPYLGLKYAVECVALRIAPDNPARAEVDALAELVNGEVASLRELISGLRTGSARGDDALVPAVRRQVRRFGLLFGIDVAVDCPDTLPTTRALAGALFHMINEALNNIRKHTTARHVWITLTAEPAAIRLVVRDDSPIVSGRTGEQYRPTSLSERAAELGGTLHIGVGDSGNTELVICIPV
ncbi:MAG: histidine kinase [Burkholderiales bacterium]